MRKKDGMVKYVGATGDGDDNQPGSGGGPMSGITAPYARHTKSQHVPHFSTRKRHVVSKASKIPGAFTQSRALCLLHTP